MPLVIITTIMDERNNRTLELNIVIKFKLFRKSTEAYGAELTPGAYALCYPPLLYPPSRTHPPFPVSLHLPSSPLQVGIMGFGKCSFTRVLENFVTILPLWLPHAPHRVRREHHDYKRNNIRRIVSWASRFYSNKFRTSEYLTSRVFSNKYGLVQSRQSLLSIKQELIIIIITIGNLNAVSLTPCADHDFNILIFWQWFKITFLYITLLIAMQMNCVI